jgi:hypothetical protein
MAYVVEDGVLMVLVLENLVVLKVQVQGKQPSKNKIYICVFINI